MKDTIYRSDAIEAVRKIVPVETAIDATLLDKAEVIVLLSALPSAENSNAKTQNSNEEPTVIRSRTLMPTNDFKEWAKRIREVNPDAVVIPCDAEVVSAEAVQGEWIDIDNYYRMATCSHCHKVTMFEKWGEYTKPYNFCPNCGARMFREDGEEWD